MQSERKQNNFLLLANSIRKMLLVSHHLRLYFPQYNGPDHDVSAAKEFIREKYLACNMNKGRIILVYFTTATDTDNIQVVFDVVLDVIS